MQEILEVIDSYGIDTVVLALIINVLTGIVKIPIKHLSTKLEPKGIHLNKYITLLPIVLGFRYPLWQRDSSLNPAFIGMRTPPYLRLLPPV